MRRAFTLLLMAGLLAGCGTRREGSVAHASKDPQGKWEIRLDAKEWVAGGPCNITFPRRIHISHWIYVDTLEGEVPATRVTLAYERGTNNIQGALHGSVTFAEGKMRVALECPYYDKQVVSIDHYTHYELNGIYELKRE